jgi:hypothetical protein
MTLFGDSARRVPGLSNPQILGILARPPSCVGLASQHARRGHLPSLEQALAPRASGTLAQSW